MALAIVLQVPLLALRKNCLHGVANGSMRRSLAQINFIAISAPKSASTSNRVARLLCSAPESQFAETRIINFLLQLSPDCACKSDIT